MDAQQGNLADGVYAAVLTPMQADFSCDHEKLATHSFDLIRRGCTGITLFGTTGEGPSFSLSERIEILQRLILAGFDPGKIIVANGSSGIMETVELGPEALRHRCAAVLIAPPSFYKNISDEGVLAYYREIIHRIQNRNLRVILYHIPQYSGVPVSLEVIASLRREFPDTVIGIKESEGNFSLTKAILEKFPGFKVFVGKEGHIIEAVHAGGAGAICGIANLYPELICSLYTQGTQGSRSNPVAFEAVVKALQGLPFISAAKSVMQSREGEMWHRLRPPLVPLSAAERELLVAQLREAGLET